MIAFPNPKINLGLEITRRRPDGYHDLKTVMFPVTGGWRDVLEAVPSLGDADSLTVTGRACNCPPQKNLVIKAVNCLRRSGVDVPPLDIYLRKIIPDGAGLGGGSADAAFMLKIASAIAGATVTDDFLATVAAEIGADCPFFIYNRPMLATGTGTILTPTDTSALLNKWIAIVKPTESVSTAEAYSRVTPRDSVNDITAIIANLPPSQWGSRIENAFEKSVFPDHPAIAGIKARLLNLGAEYAAMSGSGSAVFGIFPDGKLAASMSTLFPGYDTMMTKALS